jgi:diguanylate cyclase (GGDEF)-like protein
MVERKSEGNWVLSTQQAQNAVRDAGRAARRHRLRVQRQWLACANYAVFVAVSYYFVEKGALIISSFVVVATSGAVVAVNAFFFWLVASGRSKRFRDPSMTRLQIVMGALFLLLMFSLSRTYFAQDLYLIGFVMSLLFSTFQQSMKDIAVQAGVVFLAYVAVIFWRGDLVSKVVIGQGGRAMIYAIVLTWMILFAGYVSRLSNSLSARNRDLRAAMRKIEELAIKDELTGAYNRRFIHESLTGEMERAMRMGMPFSVCLLDVDHFKRVNDHYGHLAGDAVLRGLVDKISPCIRRLDCMGHRESPNLVARFGGEEFLLVLPSTALEGARVCAERVREEMEGTSFETDAGALHVTISCGAAEYRRGETVEALVGRADRALYKAKEGGRNRVEEAA